MEAVLTEIGKLCVSGAFKGVRYAMQKKSLVKGLGKIKIAILAWLVDANSAHLTSQAETMAVEQLICKLDEVRDLLDGIATRELIITAKCGNNSMKKVLTWISSPSLNPVVSSFKDVRRIKAFMEELVGIAGLHNHLGSMLRRPLGTRTQERWLETGPLSSEIVVGRDVDRDNVISLLFHSVRGLENFSVVSVVGIGGKGKTTLAQCVFNDERVINHFGVRLWVHVPQELVVKDVVRKMVELATNENIPETAQLTQLQDKLHPLISSNRYLLVLDNIWDHNLELNWPSLMQQLGFGVPGSMVLATTRSLKVAKTIGSVAQYMLGDLEYEDSWRLFKIHAFEHAHDQESALLEAIGKQIVRKLPNIPLLLRSVGRHLRGHNRTISYWEEFKHKLDSLVRYDGFPNVLETLKLTYDDLGFWIKRCFACCSLFPKGYKFRANELIYLWIALELVEPPSDKSQSLVDVAKSYIDCLEEEGLVYLQKKDWVELEPGEGEYWINMHDVIHDLALFIGSPKFKMMGSEIQEVDEMIQHISFTEYAKLSANFPCSLLRKMKKQMQSLLVLPGYHYVKFILKGLSDFKRLKVLGLSKAGLEEVPGTIGDLRFLRYLDLSKNNEIKKLPSSITNLVNLVYLNLYGCEQLKELPVELNKLQNLVYLDLRNCQSLSKLPRGITKLVKLRELHLRGCWRLRQMPLGMRSMTRLRRLDLFVVDESNFDDDDDDDEEEVGGLAELSCLNNLEGELTIQVDGSRVSSESEARKANLLGKKKLTKLVIMLRQGSNGQYHEMILEGFQLHTNLKIFEIYGYGGRTLPSWIDHMPNLKEVQIFDSESRICSVGSFGRLHHLNVLEISDRKNMEYIERLLEYYLYNHPQGVQ